MMIKKIVTIVALVVVGVNADAETTASTASTTESKTETVEYKYIQKGAEGVEDVEVIAQCVTKDGKMESCTSGGSCSAGPVEDGELETAYRAEKEPKISESEDAPGAITASKPTELSDLEKLKVAHEKLQPFKGTGPCACGKIQPDGKIHKTEIDNLLKNDKDGKLKTELATLDKAAVAAAKAEKAAPKAEAKK